MSDSQLDPVTVEVIRNYYKSTADQMSNALVRASFNPIIYEVRDFSVGVYNRGAELVAEGKGLPVFMGTLSFAIRAVVEYMGEANIEDGDVLLSTYPYWTGSHSQDAVVIRPIFVAGKIFGYAASKAHWMDLGAKDIYGTDTTDIWQEGLQLFGVKIVKKTVLDRELVEIIRANSRVPEGIIGDMTAQIAACELAAKRIQDLVGKYGAATVESAVARILDHGEQIARAAIAAMPDGEWVGEAAIDSDGISADPVPIRVTLKIKDSQMYVDTRGSSPRTVGPINCPLASTISAFRLVMKMIVAPHYDANEGFFRALTITAPEDSLLNPRAPAPVLLYGWATMAVGEALFAALAQGVPERSVARSGADIGALLFSGNNAKDGSFFAGGCDEACGQGASAEADGENALIHFALGECRNIPVEIIEERFPILVERYALAADSGGPGQRRGGLGVDRQWKALSDLSLISVIEQTKGTVSGVQGARGGRRNSLVLYPDTSGQRREGKLMGYKVRAGESLRIETGGGSGWGNPLDRSSDAVLADVVGGYISVEAAERDYAVVIRTAGQSQYAVDEARTATLRRSRASATA